MYRLQSTAEAGVSRERGLEGAWRKGREGEGELKELRLEKASAGERERERERERARESCVLVVEWSGVRTKRTGRPREF